MEQFENMHRTLQLEEHSMSLNVARCTQAHSALRGNLRQQIQDLARTNNLAIPPGEMKRQHSRCFSASEGTIACELRDAQRGSSVVENRSRRARFWTGVGERVPGLLNHVARWLVGISWDPTIPPLPAACFPSSRSREAARLQPMRLPGVWRQD